METKLARLRRWKAGSIHDITIGIQVFITHSKNYPSNNMFWAPMTYWGQKGLFIVNFMQACLGRKSEESKRSIQANLEWRTRTTFRLGFMKRLIWYRNQGIGWTMKKESKNTNGVRTWRWEQLLCTSKDDLRPRQNPSQDRCESLKANTKKVVDPWKAWYVLPSYMKNKGHCLST